MSATLISIVLPIHNQADHLSRIINAYESALSTLEPTHELLLIANACTDGSLEICRELAGVHRAVRVIETKLGGWGLAVKLGLSSARGDLLCFTNAARTSPEDLALLLSTACSKPGHVVKARRKVRESWTRRLGSLLYNIECRFLLDLPYWDVNGTPKVFPRTFDKLLKLTHADDLIDAEFGAIVARERYPVLEVPIHATQRHGGRSTTSYRSARGMYIGALRLAREMREASR